MVAPGPPPSTVLGVGGKSLCLSFAEGLTGEESVSAPHPRLCLCCFIFKKLWPWRIARLRAINRGGCALLACVLGEAGNVNYG